MEKPLSELLISPCLNLYTKFAASKATFVLLEMIYFNVTNIDWLLWNNGLTQRMYTKCTARTKYVKDGREEELWASVNPNDMSVEVDGENNTFKTNTPNNHSPYRWHSSFYLLFQSKTFK